MNTNHNTLINRNYTMSKLYSLIFSEKIHEIVDLHMKIMIQVKDKAVPLQAWGGPEGSRKLRCIPDNQLQPPHLSSSAVPAPTATAVC